jgi:hypothetical protein
VLPAPRLDATWESPYVRIGRIEINTAISTPKGNALLPYYPYNAGMRKRTRLISLQLEPRVLQRGLVKVSYQVHAIRSQAGTRLL